MVNVKSEKIIRALANAAMTTEQLKEKSGVGRNTISKMCNHDTAVRPYIIGKIAMALNVKVEDLI